MTRNVRLKIRDIYSPDVDIHSWQPKSRESCRFPLELEIGEEGDERQDLFQVMVATPEALRAGATVDSVISDRATLVISEYSYARLRRAIDKIVEQCESSTWEESVLKLQRYFRWEYEDYVPDDA